MKILMVPSWYPPKGGRVFSNQAEALVSIGHQVDVLILEERGVTDKQNSKINNQTSIKVNEIRKSFYRIPKLNDFNISRFIKSYTSFFIKYLKTNKPDVILVQSVIWAGVAIAKVALEKKIPFVIFEHRSIFLKNNFPFNNDLKLKIQFSLNSANKVLAVSNGLKNALKQFTSNAIKVVPNMINVDDFKPSTSVCKNEQFTIISVGNLIDIKGFDVLIRSFCLLKNDNIRLNIVGIGKEFNRLKQLCNDLGINQNVSFLFYLSKEALINEYNKAHIYVSSSNFETFGMTTVESMACGLPVVATKTAGSLDLINKNNGLLVEINSAQNLSNSFKQMIENYANFEPENIRQEVVDKYSNGIVVAMIEKELKICLNKNQ